MKTFPVIKLISYGPISQIDIQASPRCAESRENPAGIMNECQALANYFNLPVAFSCELWAGGFCRYTFNPAI